MRITNRLAYLLMILSLVAACSPVQNGPQPAPTAEPTTSPIMAPATTATTVVEAAASRATENSPSGIVTVAITSQPIPTEEQIGALLADYGRCLSTGLILKDATHSPEMKELLQERRDYYEEFFRVGLHSELLGINSSFDTIRSITRDPQRERAFRVKAVELLTFRARSLASPDDHPLVQAAEWALSQMDDPAVEAHLLDYIDSMKAGIAESAGEAGYEIASILEHDLWIVADEQGLQIIQDAYTDTNPQDNPEGTDTVEWTDGQFARKRPDFSSMPEYAIWHTPIEVLGKRMLDDFGGGGGEQSRLGPIPPGLSVEEHALKGAPQLEPLTFEPVEGSQQEILEKHQHERNNSFPDRFYSDNRRLAISAPLGDGVLVATETAVDADGGQKLVIEVLRGGKTVYTIQAGDVSPITALRGLWTYDDHWLLEVTHVLAREGAQNEVFLDVSGEVIVDGESLNERYGFEETFRLPTDAGPPVLFLQAGWPDRPLLR
jgi:hypothetical protein